MDIVENPSPVDVPVELDRLAARYRAADGVGIKLLNKLGGSAGSLLDRLPGPVRAGLDAATERALYLSVDAAEKSRAHVPDQNPWVDRAVTTAMGAAGGFGGLPTALLELPATTTVLMRAIQGVAVAHGFDPKVENVRFDCVRVFAAAGPLANDDEADLGFLTLRLSLTGHAMKRLISIVAPRLSVVLGQKLAAQAVPVLGAAAGAATNYLFTAYYQDIAQVHFGLRRLSVESGEPEAELIEALRIRLQDGLTSK